MYSIKKKQITLKIQTVRCEIPHDSTCLRIFVTDL